MTDGSIFTVVTVDVLALVYHRATRRVLFGAPYRFAPPFEGERALPGVVVRAGERLADASARALDKLDAATGPAALGQLRTFDEPARDPRGPSLSVAMWAAYDAATEQTLNPLWQPIDNAPHLAFDHDRISAAGRQILAQMIWRDPTFTRALTGEQFTATDAVAITAQLSGAPVHRANLNRDLHRIPDLFDAGVAASGGGRPPKLWRWRSPQVASEGVA